MLTEKQKLLIDRAMQAIWEEKQRITLPNMKKHLFKNTPLKERFHIPQQTYSRMLQQFLEDNDILKLSTQALQELLMNEIHKLIENGVNTKVQLKAHIGSFLKQRKIYSPAPARLDRIIGNIIHDFQQESHKTHSEEISNLIGQDIRSVEIVQRFLKTGEFEYYKPIYKGKLGFKKMCTEFAIMVEIKNKLQRANLNIDKLLELPDIHVSKVLIERSYPSVIQRAAREVYAIHLLNYYIARYQDAVDIVIQCFIKHATLLHYNIKQESDEITAINDHEVFSKNQFHEILEAYKKNPIVDLTKYKDFLERGARREQFNEIDTTFYELLATRYKHSRRFTRKLVEFEFEGLEKNARIIVEVLEEIFKLRKFKEPVDLPIVERLNFRHVPQKILTDRKLFEPYTLDVLAGYIKTGRIIVKHSRRYRNILADLPENRIEKGKISSYVSELRRSLDQSWKEFGAYLETHPDLCIDGKIRFKKPSAVLTKDE